MKRFVVIVAGGKGLRMGGAVPKQFLLLCGKPILMHTIDKFASLGADVNVTLALPKDDMAYWKQLCEQYHFTTPHQVVEGGATRFYSVYNALSSIETVEGVVAIHDGVRPLVSKLVIEDGFATALAEGSAIPTLPVIDSMRLLDGASSKSVNRANYCLVQTPQIFDLKEIKLAYNKALQQQEDDFLDDASVYEKYVKQVCLITGNRENIKITNPQDIAIAETFFNMAE